MIVQRAWALPAALAVVVVSAAPAGVARAQPAGVADATAATAGMEDRDYLRGLAYRNGSDGLPRDAALAVRSLTQAAERGVPEAMFILSHMLAEGEGTPRDAAAARRWLEAAAQAEYPEALQEMAMNERDPVRAAALLREAAHAMQHRAHGR